MEEVALEAMLEQVRMMLDLMLLLALVLVVEDAVLMLEALIVMAVVVLAEFLEFVIQEVR